MIRICYSKFHIGDRKFGEKEPLEDKRETHGLCETCLGKEIENIENIKNLDSPLRAGNDGHGARTRTRI